MEKEIKKVDRLDEKLYSCQEVLSITSLNQGEKFFINKKFNKLVLTKDKWIKLFKDNKLEYVTFLI